MQESQKAPEIVRLKTLFIDPGGGEKRRTLPVLRLRHSPTRRSFYHEFTQLLGSLRQAVARRDFPATFHNAFDTEGGNDGDESPVGGLSVDPRERGKLTAQVEELRCQQQELRDLVSAKDNRINELIGLVQRLTKQPDEAVARLCQVPRKR